MCAHVCVHVCVPNNQATQNQTTKTTPNQKTKNNKKQKVDIEGHEVAMLGALRAHHALPAQVVVEMHYHREGWTALAPVAVKNEPAMALIFAHLAGLGYGVVAREGLSRVVVAVFVCSSDDIRARTHLHAH